LHRKRERERRGCIISYILQYIRHSSVGPFFLVFSLLLLLADSLFNLRGGGGGGVGGGDCVFWSLYLLTLFRLTASLLRPRLSSFSFLLDRIVYRTDDLPH
jgi:hypothetical protein